MAIITYEGFKANATEGDLQAIATLLAGNRIGATDLLEAEAYRQIAERLYQPGVEVLTKYSYSKERVSGVEWHIFEGRVDPVAVGYMARLANEGLVASQPPV